MVGYHATLFQTQRLDSKETVGSKAFGSSGMIAVDALGKVGQCQAVAVSLAMESIRSTGCLIFSLQLKQHLGSVGQLICLVI